jgi:hypothetical protein
MIAASAERVPAQTDPEIQAEIRRAMEQRVCYLEAHPDEIESRLQELDREWDIERALETMSASVTLFGLAMGLLRSRAWLVLPLAVQGFFLQHALQGWCPPLPLLRRMGFRTEREIEEERAMLLRINGDAQPHNERRRKRAASKGGKGAA